MNRARGARRWGALLAAGALALLATPALASPSGDAGAGATGAGMPNSASVVKVKAKPARLTAAPGQSIAIELSVEIKRGWHLYAHGDTAFYGIALTGLEESPLGGAAITYPVGRRGDFFGQPVQLLAGRQKIAITGDLPDTVRAGIVTLPLALEVQACDDERCLAPAAVPVPVVLEVRGERGR